VIRGFLAGVAWGGVVAGMGLAVISQVVPDPVVAPVAGADVTAPQPAEVSGTTASPAASPVVTGPAPDASQPVPAAPADPAPAVPASGGGAVAAPPDPAVLPDPATLPADAPTGPVALVPDVVAVAEPPVAPAVAPPLAGPDLPALTTGADPAPATAASPEFAPVSGPSPDPALGSATDLPPAAPEEALLMPAPAPAAEPAPALIVPDLGQGPVAPPVPSVSLPRPDAAPDLPIARPVPLPETTPPETAAPDNAPDIATAKAALPDSTLPSPDDAEGESNAAVALPDAQDPRLPEPGFEPQDPAAPPTPARRLVPDPGLPEAEGVTVGRLPRIEADADPDSRASGAAPVLDDPLAIVPAEDLPPLRRFARPFENPDGKPLFSILLRDTGEAGLDRAALAEIAFPVTFVIDPLAPGAAEAAEVYRSAGQEILMLATGIPAGATPADLEQSFQSMGGVLAQAVGVMDQPSGGFQGNRPLAAQVVPILAAQGRGIVTFDAGLNAADQEARRAALPAAMIFRRLDAEAEEAPVIRRYLDRAAFKAAQEGRVVVLGDTRPETVAALLEWAVEGRAASVALAPVTAVMTVP